MISRNKKILPVLGIFLAVWLLVRYLLPLFLPFLLGLGLALAARPGVEFLAKKLRFPRFLAAGTGVTLAFILFVLVILLFCGFLVWGMKVLAGVLPDLENAVRAGISLLESWLLGITDGFPPGLRPVLQQNISAVFSGGAAFLDKVLRWFLSLAGNVLTRLPDSALTLGTVLISGCMISARLPRLRRWLQRRFPKEKWQPVLESARRVRAALLGWLIAQWKLSCLTFALLAAGFLLLRIPSGVLWALAVSLLDAFPVLGTGTVLLPWAFVCFLQSNLPRAVGLLGTYAVVTLLRSALEPKLVGKQLGLDPLVTLMALYAGYKLWGIGGMILAPLLTVTALQLIPER